MITLAKNFNETLNEHKKKNGIFNVFSNEQPYRLQQTYFVVVGFLFWAIYIYVYARVYVTLNRSKMKSSTLYMFQVLMVFRHER